MTAMTATTKHPQTLGGQLEEDVASVVLTLRPALLAVVQALRPPIRRASELQHLLGLDQRLSWRVFNAATAEDAGKLVSVLPGKRAMERFFNAAAEKGAPATLVKEARHAFDRFEEMVRQHAHRREDFATIASDLSGTDHESVVSLRHKRSAFNGLSAMMGRQARVYANTMIIHPTASPRLIDFIGIRNVIGLHRTRRGVPLRMMTRNMLAIWHKQVLVESPFYEALNPEDRDPHSAGLLPEFCSQPTPVFQFKEQRDGYASHELVSDNLGVSSEVSFVTAHLVRNASLYSDPNRADTLIRMTKAFELPIVAYQADMIVHESLCKDQSPRVCMYGHPLNGQVQICEEHDLLPYNEQIKYLGKSIEAACTNEIPRYLDILRYAFQQTSWKAEEFRAFRCSIEYPIVSSRMNMFFDENSSGSTE